MMSDSNDSGGGLGFVILVMVLVIAAIIAVGIVGANLIIRYARSVWLALSWLVFHFGFFYLGASLGDGEDDTKRTGFEVLSQDYLWHLSPLHVYLAGAAVFAIATYVMYARLDDETRTLITEEVQTERAKRTGVGPVTKALLMMGAGVLSYKAGRKAGESLL